MALDLPHHPHSLHTPTDELDDFADEPNSTAFSATVAPQTLFQPPPSTPSSSSQSQAASASASAPSASEPKIDHRKKRRNRTTQSCLSCHQNKRKVCVSYASRTGRDKPPT